MTKKGHETFYKIVMIAMVLIGLKIIFVTYLLVWPFKTVIFHEQPFPVMKKILVNGEIVPFRIRATRYTNSPCEVTVRFVNETIHVIPSYWNHDGAGEVNRISGSVYIPWGLPTGVYKLQITYRFPMNPLRDIIVKAETEEFEVKNK